jgi:phospholipid-binding lipoprotein MlaA
LISMDYKPSSRLRSALYACLLAATLAGCATGQDPRDPYEAYNRKMYAFNNAVDRAVVKPVAEGYQKVTPQPVRTGIRNFFDNLYDVVSLANNILMLRPVPVMNDLMRVSVNTVFGLGGLIDVASSMGLEKNQNGFGDTLAHYGWDNSAYFVPPLYAPSTVRDTLGLGVDYFSMPSREIFTTTWTDLNSTIVNQVDERARLLSLEPAREAALDEYAFTRDAWLAYRARQLGQSVPQASTDEEDIDIDELVSPEPQLQ